MDYTGQQPQKIARSNASLERKLTLLEFGRRIWLVISLDILIVILFFAGMILRCEQITGELDLVEGQTGRIPPGDWSISEAYGYIPEGRYANFGQFYFYTENNRIVRKLWSEDPDIRRFIQTLERVEYSIGFPAPDSPDEKYYIVTFTFYDTIVAFEHVFAVLLCFEVIGLLGSLFNIRRSVRRSLRPIYDLTLAARSMSVTAPATVLPQSQELHLSGAIDTLNTITENDLDRRIIISDEREELRGLAEAINAMLDRLDAAYRSQLRFVSDASHELRTPIAVIQGYANLLDRWGKNEQMTLQESIDAIKSEASGMQDLVEQLLFLARSDNRSIMLNIEDVDVCALASEVIRETQMIDPGHEFSSRLDGELKARGDIQLLKQALRIFADNAVKYTPAGGRITISANSEKGYVKISISDNGIGIPAEDLPHIFDRFFRSDESRTRDTGGTGLGLSIAKWIVDRHGGYVEVVSREDIGTKMTVALPELAASV